MEMKSSASLEIRLVRPPMVKVKCGYSYWKKHGLKYAEVMRLVRWALPLRHSTILMEHLLNNSTWMLLKEEASSIYFGMLSKRLMLTDMWPLVLLTPMSDLT